ncbi:type III polyketide synthase [Streptacidiphilus pinicola]|uniref:Type III polyketide synthase n=1 Tax=Streptacidiphilus pinicola TaxID=2219663 RepID=A0A2X0KKT7_9ACTN|nr:3-oxoacyl-[acyl-carrier-protein] synthase III C-terminal domain-containing protein [Streptacidiphilus pinicola]RAG87290.1 type III polyketide synthase [Streptacidiphilus pinicola]
MTRIIAVHGVLPPRRYAQQEITRAVAATCRLPRDDRRLLERVHASAGVNSRHLIVPLEDCARMEGFGARNDAYLRGALDLGYEAVKGALDRAGVAPDEVDLVVSSSVTGIAAPSMEARLAAGLGLRPDVKRLPLFGLGCAGGAAGLARLHDYLIGHPDHTAVLLSVELCSLTLQQADASLQNLVAGALFGDGAAAVVAVGARRAAGGHAGTTAGEGPEVVAARSHLFPGTENLLGWTIRDTGFHIMLGADLPDLVRRHLGDTVQRFLADHDVKTEDVTAWVCHPGGPKVLDAVRDALGLPARALESSWRSLAAVGNLSSASVLHILRDTLDGHPPPGSPGLLLAMGPGFAVELVLLRW